MDNLIGLQNVRRCNAGACGANIERLGKFDELDARRVRSAQKNRYLQTDSRGPTPLHVLQVLPFLKTVDFHSGGPIVLAN
jgi:hypothetical protein